LGSSSTKEDAMKKIDPKDGKYQLGGSKDAELEGIDKKYSVFTDDDKLADAQSDYPASEGYTWFVSFSIKENGNDVSELREYRIKFDKPENADTKLYYYLKGSGTSKGTLHEIPFEDTANKGNKKRVKAYLKIGDPPMGTVP
jgi:hypothetical protein